MPDSELSPAAAPPPPNLVPCGLGPGQAGRLADVAQTAVAGLSCCTLCPRQCCVDRAAGRTGFCRTGRQAVVASFGPHHGEEDCLRGWAGSGTVFFGGCSLGCAFCQNADISRQPEGPPVSAEALAAVFLQVQRSGCHNLNLVTPSHVVPQVLEALALAIPQGLCLPLVYNCGGYERLETLRLLDGLVDIYMPDFKFMSPELTRRYLHAADYPAVAQAALREMQRQVGDLVLDDSGLARRGVLVRHLVMPGGLDDTRAIMRFLAHEVSPGIYVNVMAQYHPAGDVSARCFPELNRCLRPDEYRQALAIAREEGVVRLDRRS